MVWRSEPTSIDAFAERNVFLSTSPESGFVKVLTVQRRDTTGIDILRGLTLKRVGAGAFETTLTTEGEFAEVLREVFGLDLDAFGDDAVPALGEGARRARPVGGRGAAVASGGARVRSGLTDSAHGRTRSARAVVLRRHRRYARCLPRTACGRAGVARRRERHVGGGAPRRVDRRRAPRRRLLQFRVLPITDRAAGRGHDRQGRSCAPRTACARRPPLHAEGGAAARAGDRRGHRGSRRRLRRARGVRRGRRPRRTVSRAPHRAPHRLRAGARARGALLVRAADAHRRHPR